MSLLCHNDMIKQWNIHQTATAHQSTRELPIVFGRFKITAWMIVGQDCARRVCLAKKANNVARMNLTRVNGTAKHHLESDKFLR